MEGKTREFLRKTRENDWELDSAKIGKRGIAGGCFQWAATATLENDRQRMGKGKSSLRFWQGLEGNRRATRAVGCDSEDQSQQRGSDEIEKRDGSNSLF